MQNKDNKQIKDKLKQLNAGTYDYIYYLLVSKDYEDVNLVTRDLFEDKNYDLRNWYDLDNPRGIKPRGLLLSKTNYSPILWIPNKPTTPRQKATLSHEIFHLAFLIMDWASIPLTESSEEAWCHLIAHLTNDIYKNIKGMPNR